MGALAETVGEVKFLRRLFNRPTIHAAAPIWEAVLNRIIPFQNEDKLTIDLRECYVQTAVHRYECGRLKEAGT